MRLLTAFGILLSLGWLVGIPIYVAKVTGASAFFAMSLNEQGDFFAGLFAPLALLWLVIGYFQQGRELAQNSDALRQQAAETEKLAAQAKAQAEEAQRQAEGIAVTADQARRDTFFRMAELMERDLASLAAEMYRHASTVRADLRATREATAWQRFGHGDRGAMARLLREIAPDTLHREIANGALRSPARRYAAVFEKLLSECDPLDDPSRRPISGLYEWSDTGELYGQLCPMLNRSPDGGRGRAGTGSEGWRSLGSVLWTARDDGRRAGSPLHVPRP